MAKKRAKKNDAARELAITAARLADHDNCEDIVVLDLRGISPVTEYFVICHGTSDRQMRTLADELADYGKSAGQRVYRIAGLESADWILMDFVNVVVHIFDETLRKYYDLELIWGEAPRVQW